MKANFRVIGLTALATSAIWALAIGALLSFSNQRSHHEEYVAVFSVPSRAPTPARLVIEQLEAAYTNPRREIVQWGIPAGETQHFGIRMVQTAAATNQ
jgi:hypothetical protein